MKPYEAILIFDPKIQEDKIDASVAKFEKKIKDSGGTDLVTAKWGMKKLATPIKKATDGFYVFITFNGEGKTPNELKALLNVSEEVFRYSVMFVKPVRTEPRERDEKVEIEPSMILPADMSAPSESTIGGQATTNG